MLINVNKWKKSGVFKYAKNVPYYSKSVPNCSKSVSKLYINDRFWTFRILLAHLRTESGTSIIVLGSNFSNRVKSITYYFYSEYFQ